MLSRASDTDLVSFGRNRRLQGLAVIFIIGWVLSAIAPLDGFAWFLENLLVVLVAGLLAWFHRRRPVSDLSYLLVTLFLLLHLMGAHYTYSLTPAGFWVQDLFGLERNHYDRVIHFAFGFLIVYPLAELFLRYSSASSRLSRFAALTLIASMSVGYEIVEWIVAIIVSPDAAMTYLGTQGDVFDAQKDSLLAILGASAGLILTTGLKKPAPL